MHPRVNILGVGISAVNMDQALDTIEQWIKAGSREYVCVAASHSVMACREDPELRYIFNHSGLTTPDGMPMVWLARLYGHNHVTRVYGPDLMLAMSERSRQARHRYFLYGGTDVTLDHLADKLTSSFLGLEIVGTYAPPFGPLTADEDKEIVGLINTARPDVVWVALGTGKQERWMAEHLRAIEAPVMIGVGAAFDFLSGQVRQAPAWMRSAGLEWLFRLAIEPRRLAGRYAAYPLFVALVVAQLAGLRKYRLT